jgi:hypothetical protein
LTFSGRDTISKIDLSHCATDTKDIPAKKGLTDYDGYKKVKGIILSALVDRNVFPLPAQFPRQISMIPQLYEPTLEAFEIPEVQDHPTIISADAAYDAREIRQYNRKRGISRSIGDLGNS